MKGEIGPHPGGKSETARQMAIAMAGQGKRVLIYCLDLVEAVHGFRCTMERAPHLTQSPWHDTGPPAADANEYSITIGLGGELRFITANPSDPHRE